MLKLFSAVSQAIAIIVALVQIVERPGDGPEKREQVIQFFVEEGRKHLDLPSWAAALFLRESFVGWLVDLIVWAANSFGFFESADSFGTA